MSAATRALFTHFTTYFQLKEIVTFSKFIEEFIGQFVAFQSSMVIVYFPRHRPKVLFHKLNQERENNISNYLSSAYAFDPFFQKSNAIQTYTMLRLDDIAPEGFQSSTYFKNYYRLSRVKDEINFMAPLSSDAIIALSIERSENCKKFNKKELALLLELTPLVCNGIAQISNRLPLKNQITTNHSYLHDAINNFGSSVLSPREQQILKLLLRGAQSRDIASKLKIKYGTVKNHRLNIYTKLDIKNQSELFTIFLAAYDLYFDAIKEDTTVDILDKYISNIAVKAI